MTLPDVPPSPLPENWIPKLYRDLNGARLPLDSPNNSFSIKSSVSSLFGEAAEASEASDDAKSFLESSGSPEPPEDSSDIPETLKSILKDAYIPSEAPCSLFALIVNAFFITLLDVVLESPIDENPTFEAMETMFVDATGVFLEEIREYIGGSVEKNPECIESVVGDLVNKVGPEESSLEKREPVPVAVFAKIVNEILNTIEKFIAEAPSNNFCPYRLLEMFENTYGRIQEELETELLLNEVVDKVEASELMVLKEAKALESPDTFVLKMTKNWNSQKNELITSSSVLTALEDVIASYNDNTSIQVDSEDVEASEMPPEDIVSIQRKWRVLNSKESIVKKDTGAASAPEEVLVDSEVDESVEDSESSIRIDSEAVLDVLDDVEASEFVGKSSEVVTAIQTDSEMVCAPEDVSKDSEVDENVLDGFEDSEASENDPDVVTSIQFDSEGLTEDSEAGDHVEYVPNGIQASESVEKASEVVTSIQKENFVLASTDSENDSCFSTKTIKLSELPDNSTLNEEPSDEVDSIQKDCEVLEDASEDSKADEDVLNGVEASEALEKYPEVVTLIQMESDTACAPEDVSKDSGDSDASGKAPDFVTSIQMDSEVDEHVEDVLDGVQASESSEMVPEVVLSIQQDSGALEASENVLNDSAVDENILEDAQSSEFFGKSPEVNASIQKDSEFTENLISPYSEHDPESSTKTGKAPEATDKSILEISDEDDSVHNVSESSKCVSLDPKDFEDASESTEKNPEVVTSNQKDSEAVSASEDVLKDSEADETVPDSSDAFVLSETSPNEDALIQEKLEDVSKDSEVDENVLDDSEDTRASEKAAKVDSGAARAPEDVPKGSEVNETVKTLAKEDLEGVEASAEVVTSPLMNSGAVSDFYDVPVDPQDVSDSAEYSESSKKSPEIVCASEDIPNDSEADQTTQNDSEVIELSDSKHDLEFSRDEQIPTEIEIVPKFPASPDDCIQLDSEAIKAPAEDIRNDSESDESVEDSESSKISPDAVASILENSEVSESSSSDHDSDSSTKTLKVSESPVDFEESCHESEASESSKMDLNASNASSDVIFLQNHSVVSKNRINISRSTTCPGLIWTVKQNPSPPEDVPVDSESEKDTDVTNELSLSILMHAEAKQKYEEEAELSVLVEESTEQILEDVGAPEVIQDLLEASDSSICVEYESMDSGAESPYSGDYVTPGFASFFDESVVESSESPTHLQTLLADETRQYLVENLTLQCQNSSRNALRTISKAQNPNWDLLRRRSAGTMATGLAENFPDPVQFLDVYARVVQFKARNLVLQSQEASRNSRRSFRLQNLMDRQRKSQLEEEAWKIPEDLLALPESLQRLQNLIEAEKNYHYLQKSSAPGVGKFLGISPELVPKAIRIQAEILEKQFNASPKIQRSLSWPLHLNRPSWDLIFEKAHQLNAIYMPMKDTFREADTGCFKLQTPSGTFVRVRLQSPQSSNL